MVLIVAFLLLFQGKEGHIIPERYQKEVDKSIKKTFDLDDCTLAFDEDWDMYGITSSGEMHGYLYYSNIRTCKAGGCLKESEIKNDGAYEFFDFIVLLDSEHQIRNIKILKYGSDYGFEITSRRYLRKYIGKYPCDLKASVSVDGISGATVSVNALHSKLMELCR